MSRHAGAGVYCVWGLLVCRFFNFCFFGVCCLSSRGKASCW